MNIYTDRPCTTRTQDKYNYVSFADLLADSINKYDSTDGIVMALYGSWGSGKSSVLNFVKEKLQSNIASPSNNTIDVKNRKENQEFLHINFNPWFFAGQTNLTLELFKKLQNATGKVDKLNEVTNAIGVLLNILADGITKSSAVIKPLKAKYKLIAWFLACIIKFLSGLLNKLDRPSDIYELKQKIATILKEQKMKIIIYVDDIDRLTPDEIFQLFSTIKGLADFPNVIYLLAMDRDVVVNALSSQKGMNGTSFLEKIVQVPFDLPRVENNALQTALLQELDKITSDLGFTLNTRYWRSVFEEGIEVFFQTPRDVVRFINATMTTLPVVAEDVNCTDFLAIQTLRLWCPKIHSYLQHNPFLFTYHLDLVKGIKTAIGNIQNDNSPDDILTTLIDLQKDDLQKDSAPPSAKLLDQANAAKTILQHIFPSMGKYSNISEQTASSWLSERRVCHIDNFYLYYRFTSPLATVTPSDMNKMIKLLPQSKKFKSELLEWRKTKDNEGKNKSEYFFGMLRSYINTIPPEDHTASVITLLNLGDDIDGLNRYGYFTSYSLETISWIICSILELLEPNVRKDLLHPGILKKSGSIALQGLLLNELESDEPNKPRSYSSLIDKGALNKLIQKWLILTSSYANKYPVCFMEHTRFNLLIKLWSKWSQSDAKEWCEKNTLDDQNLLNFLTHMQHIETPMVPEGVMAIPTHTFYFPDFQQLLDLDKIAKRLNDMANTSESSAIRNLFLSEYNNLQRHP